MYSGRCSAFSPSRCTSSTLSRSDSTAKHITFNPPHFLRESNIRGKKLRKLKFPSTLFFALIALAVFLDFATTQIGLSLGFRESGKALFLAEALGLLFFTFVF